MALPLANDRRGLPLTVAFLAASLLVALSVGFGLGAWLLLSAAFGFPMPAGGWSALVQVHGHAQLIGFAGLLVLGVGYRILPRFRGAPEPSTPAMAASGALVAAGVLLRLVQLLPDVPGRGDLLLASGTLTLAGLLLYAFVGLDLLSGGENVHRADEIVLGAAIVWTPIGALWSLVSLAAPLGSAADPIAASTAVWALLLGSIGGHILGVSLRVAPAFIAAPVAPARLVIAGAILWNAGVVGVTMSLGLAPLVLLAGALVLVHAIGPFRRSAAVRPLPPQARLSRLAFRAGFAWLAAGLVLFALAGSVPGATAAARHALALGFLMSMVVAVGSRLVPALTGGVGFPLRAVLAALALTNAAALLRVPLELVGPASGLATFGLALSGLLAYGALVVFAAAAARTARSTFGAGA